MSKRLKPGWAWLASLCMLGPSATAAEEGGARPGAAGQGTFAPIEYINRDAARVAPPEIQGERTEAYVPDTCNLEEAARLLLEHYLTRITEPRADHEPYNRGWFDVEPPRLTMDVGSYLCALPKYREMLPLLRIMTGSEKGLEIDEAWAQNIARCIGPDGLYYIPRGGRPWDDINWSGEHTGYWWKMPADTPQYTHLSVGNGRLLGGLAVYYRVTGDETWRRIGNGIVDRMSQLAIRHGDDLFFPKFNWTPGEQLTEAEITSETASAYRETPEETDENKSLWQTWIIVGLSQYYAATGYEPARELARGLANYLRTTKYIENWGSHFHCITLGIHGMLELASATGDRELTEYARRSYDYARSGKELIAIPEIGFFVNQKSYWFKDRKDRLFMEGCSIGDMTAIAVKLATLGLDDGYWEDVDRYTRNMLTEIQRKAAWQPARYLAKHAEKGKFASVPVAYHENAEDLAEKMVGTFAQNSTPGEMFPSNYFDSCCIGNVGRALYYAWEHIIEKSTDTLTVRLLMNRTSPWADIDSMIPNRGAVTITLKEATPVLRIRLNDWVQRDKTRATVGGRSIEQAMEGDYLVARNLKAGDRLELEFPIEEVRRELKCQEDVYQAVFRGNDCVAIEPKGEIVPLFQRERHRQPEPAYLKVQRFACTHPIQY